MVFKRATLTIKARKAVTKRFTVYQKIVSQKIQSRKKLTLYKSYVISCALTDPPRWSALNPLAQTSMPTQQHETLQKVKSTCFECGAGNCWLQPQTKIFFCY